MTEHRPIPSFPGYFAGDDGVIYSTHRTKGALRPLRPGAQTNGYLVVNLVNPAGGYRMARVHALVCEAWHGPRPPGHEVSHQDDVKTNNVPSNLRWETKEQNHARRRINGIDDRGTANSRALLNNEQLAEVRRLLAEGKLTHKQIGERFGVRRLFITKIKNGHRYVSDLGNRKDYQQ